MSERRQDMWAMTTDHGPSCETCTTRTRVRYALGGVPCFLCPKCDKPQT